MSKARIVLPIEGMSCASCAATVQAALGDAAGVSTATVNYATGKGAVDYDDAQTSVAELIKTVRAAGYDCGRASVTFTVEQLHYAPSVAPLEQALRGVPGVIRAAANQATETVMVDYIPGATTADALERAVERAGFRVAAPIAAEDPLERERLAREREVRALTWKLALAAVVTVVSVLGSMLLMAHDADAARPATPGGARRAWRARSAVDQGRSRRPHVTGGGLVGRAVLSGRLERVQAPYRRHEHAHRRGHGRRLPVFARRHVRPGSPGRRGASRRRLLRGGVGHHRADPPRAAAGGACQGPDVGSDSAPGRAAPARGARGARGQGDRHRGRGGRPRGSRDREARRNDPGGRHRHRRRLRGQRIDADRRGAAGSQEDRRRGDRRDPQYHGQRDVPRHAGR